MDEEKTILLKLYEEAWKQYVHEDNIGQSRTYFFLGIQAGLLALIGGIFKPILEIGTKCIFGLSINVGYLVIGTVIALSGWLLFCISGKWKKVTSGGQSYIALRWATARAIEVKLGVDDKTSLAGLEQLWKDYEIDPGKKNGTEQSYSPFSNDDQLKKVKIPRRIPGAGWDSMMKVICMWRWSCLIIILFGIGFFVGGIIPVLRRFVWN